MVRARRTIRLLAFDLIVFVASRIIEAISLVALLVIAVALDGIPITGATEADLYSVYLIVRGYFFVLGYVQLSAVVFAGLACFGGLYTRARMIFSNTGVLLAHGLIVGLSLNLVVPTYWLVGLGMLLVSLSTTIWIFWPLVWRYRNSEVL